MHRQIIQVAAKSAGQDDKISTLYVFQFMLDQFTRHQSCDSDTEFVYDIGEISGLNFFEHFVQAAVGELSGYKENAFVHSKSARGGIRQNERNELWIESVCMVLH